jgi:magnesium transporter
MKKTQSKHNLPPGTMVYTGSYREVTHEQTLICYTESKYSVLEHATLEAVDACEGVKWLNVTGLSEIAKISEIGERYGIAPLVLEDIVHVGQRTKLEVMEAYCFAVFKMIYITEDHEKEAYAFHEEHVSFILLPSLLITFQEKPGDVFDGVRNRLKNASGRIRTLGSDYLFYALMDAIVDHQMETMAALQSEIDRFEKQIVDDALGHVEQLYSVRKQLLTLKSAVLPEQELIMKIIASDQVFTEEHLKIYFKDVEDHIVHLSDRIMMYREIVTSLFEMHQNNMSNHMNDIMKTLTIFSAIFIPLSFLAGFFGMNFAVFPGLASPYAIPLFVGVCLLIAAGMLAVFKWREWF